MLNIVAILVTIFIFYYLSNWFGGYADRLGCDEVILIIIYLRVQIV